MKQYFTLILLTLAFFSCVENAKRNQSFIKGRDALQMKEFEKAEIQLKLALEEDSLFTEAWNNLGIAYDGQGKTYEALNAYNIALKQDNCLEDAYQNKANVYYKLKDLDKAINTVSKGLTCNPENTSLLLNRATLLEEKGDFQAALADLKQLKQISGISDVLYTNLGFVFYHIGILDSAFHYSLMAIEINHKRHEAFNNLGMVEMQKKNYGEASKFFEKAIEIIPTNSVYRINLGRSYLNDKNFKESVDAFNMAVYYNEELASKETSVYSSLILNKKYQEATKLLTENIPEGRQAQKLEEIITQMISLEEKSSICEYISYLKSKNMEIDKEIYLKCK
ncbi:tetratricopeptide repeat protein [Flammeovirga sp. SubArs3]|uniref:tetratricopeptide repeat protein n=1 Tax=Flammeovirga sp. SubArs3 TaxID=2995316 RepID=UPI00248BA780|nr:tetratricopeptide repeat protein [Flammeovirga sp. SubArs3]